MSFEKVEKLLRNTMGLTSESVGVSAIERATKTRMKACQITDPDAYYLKVSSSMHELKELTEVVIIPETWFFRDYQPFIAIQDYVKSVWRHSTVLKILSLPCSSGEEPYSIAMSLLQAGLQREQFMIDAVDISFHNIEQSKKAIYGTNSFRGDNLEFRDQFFTRQNSHYVLSEAVRSCVRFSQGNLLDLLFRPMESSYQLIFCRNLLIYFDRETQTTVVKKFHQLLSDHGILLVGHAEMGAVDNRLFTSTQYTKAFAFSKRHESDQIKAAPPPIRTSSQKQRPVERRKSVVKPLIERRAKRTKTKASQSRRQNNATVESILRQAESFANSGHLVEAVKLCQQYLQQNNQDPGGYFLLGIIREEVGEKEDAFEQFKRVIYLDPNHYDAFMHLAMLSEQKRDSECAKSYRDRAQRVKSRYVKSLGNQHG